MQGPTEYEPLVRRRPPVYDGFAVRFAFETDSERQEAEMAIIRLLAVPHCDRDHTYGSRETQYLGEAALYFRRDWIEARWSHDDLRRTLRGSLGLDAELCQLPQREEV